MAKGETGFELASVMLAVELESKEMSWVGGVTYVCLRFYSNLLFHKYHFWLLLFTGESHSFSSGGKRYFSQSKNWIRKNSSVSSLQRSAPDFQSPYIDTLFRAKTSTLLPCLGQRTKGMPSCFKAIFWQLQLRKLTQISCTGNVFGTNSHKIIWPV